MVTLSKNIILWYSSIRRFTTSIRKSAPQFNDGAKCEGLTKS